MSVSSYFGATESGKSYHVQSHVIPTWDKVIVFDPAHCFKNGDIFEGPTNSDFSKIFFKCLNSDKFRIIIRPVGRGSRLVTFNKTCELAFTLGEELEKGLARDKRIQLVVDEADSICSSQFKSEPLHHLINEARHDNVDSHFIARLPQRIHTDIRANSSKVVTFRIQGAEEVPFLVQTFTRDVTRKIKDLPQYWRLEWTDNDKSVVFDEKNKINEKFLGISQEKRGIKK